ncbi:MAG: hypothetical protein ACK5JT_11155 [Hyphomicrobiaceae bacterium]
MSNVNHAAEAICDAKAEMGIGQPLDAFLKLRDEISSLPIANPATALLQAPTATGNAEHRQSVKSLSGTYVLLPDNDEAR